ncbi:MAG: TIM barrel protein [Bryobacteraceae bacterium]
MSGPSVRTSRCSTTETKSAQCYARESSRSPPCLPCGLSEHYPRSRAWRSTASRVAGALHHGIARLARDVGATLVRVFTGYEHPAASYSYQWKLIVDVLRESSKRASEFGVTIGVQNHHDIGVGFENHYDLITEVAEPNCRALFDAWAPSLHGADLKTAAKKMAPLTAHTTIADYQLRPRYRYSAGVVNYEALLPYSQAVPMGEGFIDYNGFLAEMSSQGFNGTIAYEMCSPLIGGGTLEVLDRYARKFLEYMKGQ